MLQHTGVDHGDGRKHEAHEDTCDGVKVNLVLAQQGINDDWQDQRLV